jgi:hypothetical protein
MKTELNNLFMERYFENRLLNDKKRFASFDIDKASLL